MSESALVITVSLLSGVAGTFIGGVLGVLFKNKSAKLNAAILSFAGGVMLGVVSFEMIPEGIALSVVNNKAYSGVLISLTSVIFGIVLVYLINKLIYEIENRRSNAVKSFSPAQAAILNSGGYIYSNARIFANAIKKRDAVTVNNGRPANDADARASLRRAGILMTIAIAVHNLPEGIAVGASGAVDVRTGIIVAVIIALHDIPEGTAVSAPLAGGGMSVAKSLLLTFLSGLTTVIGALIGLFAGEISNLSSGICLSFAGGAMLYVTLLEIFPEAYKINRGKAPAFSMLFGFLISLLIVFLV